MAAAIKDNVMGAEFFARLGHDVHETNIRKHFGARILAPGAAPRVSSAIFLLFTNRSGSNLVGDLLRTAGFANRAGEPLNHDFAIAYSKEHGIGYFSDFLASVDQRAVNGTVAIKASLPQYDFLRRAGVLDRLYPDRRIVVTERLDKVAQAVSWLIATQTRAWTAQHAAAIPLSEVRYDEKVIGNFVRSAYRAHASMELYLTLSGEPYCRAVYEEVAAEPVAAMGPVLRFLGYPEARADPSRLELRRQETALNREFRARFIASHGAALGRPG